MFTDIKKKMHYVLQYRKLIDILFDIMTDFIIFQPPPSLPKLFKLVNLYFLLQSYKITLKYLQISSVLNYNTITINKYSLLIKTNDI